jgi:hypothetical protein
MYKCQVTGRMSRPGEKCNKIVTATRERIYYTKFRNEETGRWEDVEVGRGWEIVKEINATDEAFKQWDAKMKAADAALERIAKLDL